MKLLPPIVSLRLPTWAAAHPGYLALDLFDLGFWHGFCPALVCAGLYRGHSAGLAAVCGRRATGIAIGHAQLMRDGRVGARAAAGAPTQTSALGVHHTARTGCKKASELPTEAILAEHKSRRI